MSLTKVTAKNLTSVPSEIRKKLNIEPGDELEWIAFNEEIVVKPRKKRRGDPLKEIIGIVQDEPTDVTRDHNRLLYGTK